jgi:hypothetical protein
VVPNRDAIPDDNPENLYIPATSILRQRPTILDDDDEESLRSFHFSLASFDTTSLIAPSSIRRPRKDNMTTIATVNNDTDEELEVQDTPSIEPVWSKPEDSMEGAPSIIKFAFLNDRRRVVTENSEGAVEMWDLVLCRKIKHFGQNNDGELFESVQVTANTFEWVAQWCSVDIKNGVR